MVPVSRLALLIMPLLFVAGCGSDESASAPQDAPAVQAVQQQEAQQVWTQDKQEAYRNALSRAHSEREGTPVSAPAPSGNSGGTQVGLGGTSPNVSFDNPDGDPNYRPPQGQTSSAPTVPSGRPNDVGSTGSDPMVGK